MDLSLNEAERSHLAALGVAPDAQGVLRSAGGREVSPATAVALLAKSTISPQQFRRGPLTDGHAAPFGSSVDHGDSGWAAWTGGKWNGRPLDGRPSR